MYNFHILVGYHNLSRITSHSDFTHIYAATAEDEVEPDLNFLNGWEIFGIVLGTIVGVAFAGLVGFFL